MTLPKHWASSANFPAGADPWSGTPNKVEPSLAEAQTGFVPGQQVDAEILNWLIHYIATGRDVDQAFSILNQAGGSDNTHVLTLPSAVTPFGVFAYREPQGIRGQVGFIIGTGTLASNDDLQVVRSDSGDFRSWTPVLFSDLVMPGGVAVHPADQKVLICGRETTATPDIAVINYSDDDGATWSGLETLAGDATQASACTWHAGGGGVWIVGGSVCGSGAATLGIWYSATGASFTRATTPNGSGTQIKKFATDGEVIIASRSAAGDVWRSTDHGVNWSTVSMGSSVGHAVAYDSVRSLFVSVGLNGTFYTSPDGDTWSAVVTDWFGNTSWDATDIAIVNGVWLVQLSTTTTNPLFAYSIDAGVTWHPLHLTVSHRGVYPAGDRFVILDGGGPDIYWTGAVAPALTLAP